MNTPISQIEHVPADELDDDRIDLQHYLHVLSKYKWSILALTLVITVLTVLYTFTLVPMYRSTAKLLIESQEENIVSIKEVYSMPRANLRYFETQIQILKSRELAEKVTKSLDLENHPEFDPEVRRNEFSFNINPLKWIRGLFRKSQSSTNPPSESGARSGIVNRVMGRLNVTQVNNSELIDISFEARDPELTALVPNALAEAYIESILEGRLGVTKQAADWIVGRMDNLRENVEASEIALQQYLDRENLVDVQGVDSMATQELNGISTELLSARRTLSDYDELSRQLVSLKGESLETYQSIPAILKNPNVQRANEQQKAAELKVVELSKRYGPKHPRMIAAVGELDTTTKNLEIEIRNLISSVDKEYSAAKAKVNELERQQARIRDEVKLINTKENELRKLQREVETNRQLYDMFLTRYKETNITGDLQTANARVVDRAVVPSGPFKPNKMRIVMIAVLFSLLAGAALALLIDALDNTIKTSDDVERLLHLPVLSILPKIRYKKGEEKSVLHYFSEHSNTKFAENVRTIRTGVLLTEIDEKKKTILVTSSVPSEGKSVIAANLSLALGHLGKVLLIDADMRRPSIAKVFNLAENQSAGLSHFIAETESLDQCIHYFMKDNIYVMPAGVIPPNPLELLSSKRFQAGLEKIKDAFDYVVLDSPPVIAVSDSVVMSQYVNSVAYVVKADDTPRKLAIDGLKRLRHVNAPIVGIVLNQVSPPKQPGRYDNYSSDYYHYYGYEKN